MQASEHATPGFGVVVLDEIDIQPGQLAKLGLIE